MKMTRGRLRASLLLVAVFLLITVIDNIECAKSKKPKSASKESSESDSGKKASSKKAETKEKKQEPKSEEKADKPATDAEKNETNTTSKEKKPWKKMTKADWDRLENEAEEHEPWKPPEPPNIPFDPSNPMKYVQASKKGKPAMMFATLDKVKDEKTGKMRERTKAETEEVSFKHKSLMQSGHLDATPYVIDPGKILWTVQDGSKGYTVKNFVLQQPEVLEFEWDNQKTPRSLWRADSPEAEL